MSGRDLVLRRIASALGRSSSAPQVSLDEQPSDVTLRLQGGHPHTLPAVSEDTVAALITAMESVLMSVVRLQSIDDVAKAVDWYLEAEKIDVSEDGSVTVAPALNAICWPQDYRFGPATGVEKVSVTPCLAAVAETGSVVTASGAATPASLNFLPETHILVLRESQIVRHVDDVFPMLRAQESLPRAVNFVTGPSRTADIEQTLEIGAHGPRRMHVLLVPG